jgi:predicted acyl esterase
MTGISYFATNQWYVASLQPPHLTAICAWEGAADYYRDNTHHGGILSQFLTTLYPWAVWRVQHGVGERGLRSRVTGEPVAGPLELSDEELAANRVDIERSLLAHPLDDEYYSKRSARWDKVTVPFLSAANWGGQGLHPRGNFEAFTRAASSQKWLEVHGLSHWTHFYTAYGVSLQKRFFGHFLKGEDTGWDRQPPVQLQVRHVDRFELRHEQTWPLERTRWTRFRLDPADMSLCIEDSASAGHGQGRSPARSSITYDPMGEGVTFRSPPLATETEITGPVSATLVVIEMVPDRSVPLMATRPPAPAPAPQTVPLARFQSEVAARREEARSREAIQRELDLSKQTIAEFQKLSASTSGERRAISSSAQRSWYSGCSTGTST